ncbi:DUF427 domain-containing protein [Cellulomonas marina]|uniref:Uncharacterized conserved protein, DUF427 family n=1 Tax=Cellulomonas marina TaxID=988821 RepID=A0A1I0XHR7_9CELL|nr:DUF427 domain-containing protein [Cellulomonas marina]GIG29832.1 hypothetical protein Cma02nite_24320 [Cellulomonas marina]SFB00217.1 Uncharacterized conserved protein, DUF427 family [Cellulomonas marina]
MPTATLDGTVLAEATDDEVLHIEGNVYFPPSSVRTDLLEASPTPYTCPWKGECQYWTVALDGTRLQDRAWSYPHPYPTAFDRVGRDFSGYVAFWKEVRVS